MGEDKFNRTALRRLVLQNRCTGRYEHIQRAGNYCQPYWDDILCWPPTSAGEKASQLCPVITGIYITGSSKDPSLVAFRNCLENGEWNSSANYAKCTENIHDLYWSREIIVVTAWIIIICSVISMITMGISLFIFCYFRSLYCCRLTVHRNLCIALMLYLVFLFPLALKIALKLYILDIVWARILLLILLMFSGTACCSWMFVEGLLLHSRVTTSIFKKDAPFKLYYFIGWGIPTILTIIWSSIMSQASSHKWLDYNKLPYIWIITGPQLLVLSLNTVFLVNIIRVLLTKHQANNTTEIVQFKKAVKATVLLFPLLGVMHLISAIPGIRDTDTYTVLTAIFWSSQGFMFSLLYCFLNADVRTVVKNAYRRSVIRRNPKTSIFKSSRGLSQTSQSYLSSNSEGTQLDSYKHKTNSKVAIRVDGPSPCKPQKYTIVKQDKEQLKNQESLRML